MFAWFFSQTSSFNFYVSTNFRFHHSNIGRFFFYSFVTIKTSLDAPISFPQRMITLAARSISQSTKRPLTSFFCLCLSKIADYFLISVYHIVDWLNHRFTTICQVTAIKIWFTAESVVDGRNCKVFSTFVFTFNRVM